jgi:biotin synthase-related radical SAM superfamily protein
LTERCLNALEVPVKTRVSIGTAIVLGLQTGKLDAKPTTAYLMTYKAGKCTANCGFCPQAKGSQSSTELLSRVTWPSFPTSNIINALEATAKKGKIRRVCMQALNYPNVFSQLETLVREIKTVANIPLSVSCQPNKKDDIITLKNAGVNRIGIAVDAATEVVFLKVKGAEAGGVYCWARQFGMLEDALAVFGKGNVSTHLIVGLGETEQEASSFVERCVDMGVLPALFAFTPVRGTALEKNLPPSLESYRRVQIARYLLVQKAVGLAQMRFDAKGKIAHFGVEKEQLEKIVSTGKPFQTSGCPDCNRPFYNEKPGGPFYNYPKELNKKDLEEIKKQLKI